MGNQCALFIGLWPASKLKNWALRRAGYSVARTARIGLVLIQRVSSLELDEGASIGHFTVMRDLRRVHLGENAVLGQWNWITAAPSLVDQQPNGGELHVGVDSAVTSRHYLDCSGGIAIGDFTTVAGVRSTFITHGIDWTESRQRTQAIRIGSYCLVGSNVAIAPGAVVADHSVVAMGAVVAKGLGDQGGLVIGPRATNVRPHLDGKYFSRKRGYVD